MRIHDARTFMKKRRINLHKNRFKTILEVVTQMILIISTPFKSARRAFSNDTKITKNDLVETFEIASKLFCVFYMHFPFFKILTHTIVTKLQCEKNSLCIM